MLISTISYNAIPFLQQYFHSSSPFSCYLAIYYMQQCVLLRVSMSRHKTGYVISYHGILCHDYCGIPNIRIWYLKNSNCYYSRLLASRVKYYNDTYIHEKQKMTGFGKTDFIVTIDISRNTDLKY